MKIFSIDNCPHCEKLKKLLDDGDFKYSDYNLSDEVNQKKFEPIAKITGGIALPTILVDKKILAPGKSFRTIDECYKIICSIYDKDV